MEETMKPFKEFQCAVCGNGTVRLAKGEGRPFQYSRGFSLPIPDDVLLPTCDRCSEIYMDPETMDRVQTLLKAVFARQQSLHLSELMAELKQRSPEVTYADVARVLGVTPAYLSNILRGRKEASVTLVRLFEALVCSRAELRRHLRGKPWKYAIRLVLEARNIPADAAAGLNVSSPRWVDTQTIGEQTDDYGVGAA
jgi:transcriptional regulator with XRE-family HTH domain